MWYLAWGVGMAVVVGICVFVMKRAEEKNAFEDYDG